jgi:phytoene/squalene synthetase
MADLLADLVGWTRALMLRGAPLTRNIPGSAGWELRLVVQGGLRILDKVERAGVSVLESRPRLRGYEAPLLLWRTLWMKGPASAAARKAA